MAKRIKVKGKPPRGLSKAQRIKISSLARKRNEIVNSERKRVDPGDVSESTLDAIDRYDYMIDEIAERPDISSGASSARKKLVKEGRGKFIGPRQLKSELREDADTRWRELNSEFPPSASMSQDELQIEESSARAARKNMGKERPRLRGEKGRKKLRAQDQNFGEVEGPEFGRGGISKNQRLKALLSKLMDKYYDLGF